MKTQEIAQKLDALIAREGKVYFEYAEVASQAATEDDLRQAASLSGWYDSGRQFSTLKQYREIGRAWQRPDGTFAWHTRANGAPRDVSWTVHAELASGPRVNWLTPNERRAIIAEEGVVTKRKARERAGKKPMKDDASNPSAALVSILSGDLALEDVSDDPEALTALRRFIAQAEERAAQKHGTKKRGRRIREINDEMMVASMFGDTASALGRALTRLTDTNIDAGREPIRRHIAAMREILAWAESYIDSGAGSFDDQLAALLSD